MDLSPLNLKILSDVLLLAGHPKSQWLHHLQGLDPYSLRDEDWVSAELFDQLMRACVAVTGDRCMGLVVGLSPAQSRYAAHSALVMHAPDLRTAMLDLVRYARTVTASSELAVAEQDGLVELCITPMATTAVGRRFRTEQLLAGLVMLSRWFTGGAVVGQMSLDLAYMAPDAADRYRAVLGVEACFGRPRSVLRFPAHLLQHGSAMHDPRHYADACARAKVDLAAAEARSGLRQRAQMLVMRRLSNLPGAAEAAQLLGLSERTLRRRLHADDTSWTRLVDDCRRTRALQLAMADGPLQALADALGYADASTFLRAFRRWTGQTPQAWRRQQQQPEGASAAPAAAQS